MNRQVTELLNQMLETEMGGVKIYQTALQCAQNLDLKKEWGEYLEQTKKHESIVRDLFRKLGLQDEQTPGREVVAHIGESLVKAMAMAQQAGDPNGAELVACECVVFAETKDHQNWQLLSRYAEKGTGEECQVLMEAVEEVEDEEDEHLYHSKGWCRELWIASLGMEAVLREEQKDVKTRMGAARAEQSRKKSA